MNRPVLSRGQAGRTPGRAAATLEQLLQCLRDEGDALVGGDVERLAQAVARKELALRRLTEELADADIPALRRVLRGARDLNERNARLLAPHFNTNRARIESLLGAARTGSLYSSDGLASRPQDRAAQRGVRA